MLAPHFSRYFGANPGKLHFAAHSHHPWPDATEAAHARYWDGFGDARRPQVGARLRRGGAEGAGPRRAPAEAVRCAPGRVRAEHARVRLPPLLLPAMRTRPLRVLASAHEFHSFRRQTRRLQEAGGCELVEIAGRAVGHFHRSLLPRRRARSLGPGVALARVLRFRLRGPGPRAHLRGRAAPMRWSRSTATTRSARCRSTCRAIHRRAFYLGGGYKYAMSGEGACFLAVPPGCELRPVDTGWFASFDDAERHARRARCRIATTRSASGARPSTPPASIASTPPWTGCNRPAPDR